ncbi:hypothetical protein [Streptomyces sp. NPDC058869]|uniref:hypothetical protein n=1 Tax=Streptomyces sp. NPDC058869 TaxID=3346659 RepID=UPI0036A0664A
MSSMRSDADRMRRRELYGAASGVTGPRLLPWTTPEGNPCYLSTDGRGYLSTLADGIEEVQLGMGEELVEHAREVLAPLEHGRCRPQSTAGWPAGCPRP